MMSYGFVPMGTDGRGELPQWQGDSDAPPSAKHDGVRIAAKEGPGKPRNGRSKATVLIPALVGLLVLAAIAVFALRPSDPSATADTDAPGDSLADEPSNENSDGAEPNEEEPNEAEPDEAEPDEAEPDEAETAVRVEENTGVPSEYGHWIGRNLMTSSMVELTWSPIEGDDVVFRVHRFDRVPGLDPDTAPFSDAVLVYEGTETSAVDNDVEPDRFYTYVLDADVDDETLPRRWTEALTVDDNEPPSPITGLEASVTAEGVMLSWDRSTDNVEFAAYSVSIVEDGGLRYIGGGADIEQTSFLDNQADSGEVTYAVMAVDFHDNRTEAVNITVTVP